MTKNKKSKVNRDKRTHNEKIIILREIFGRRKEVSRQSGKVNDCSINKIAEEAGLDKLWLLGHRTSKKEPSVNSSYSKLRDEINLFRNSFSKGSELSEDKKTIKELQDKLDGLHSSIEPTFIKIAMLEKKVQNFSAVATDLDTKSTQLIAKNIELEEQLEGYEPGTNKSNSVQAKRVIISPDIYRKKGGRYNFGDKKIESNAWGKALEELNKYLTRKLPMRLYILVGMPCSGKTAWSRNPDTYLENDRHPVIFDATNLTVIERIKLIQPLRRFSDLPIVCVYFDTDIELIRQCNRDSDGWERARFTDEQLTKKLKKLEKPDPYEESWIDSLRVVRRK